MSDTDVPVEREVEPTVRLRHERFDLMLKVLGAEKPGQIAQILGVDRRTVTRAQNGQIGETFIAQTISSLKRHEATLARYGLHPTLDELFEVIDPVAIEVAA
jgi:hypothetical protein